MPTAPVAYEAAARRPRTSYESRVREVLSTLGSQNPEEDIAATGSLLENSKRAKMDPAAAAGIIYATSRHQHPPTSVLGETELDYKAANSAATAWAKANGLERVGNDMIRQPTMSGDGVWLFYVRSTPNGRPWAVRIPAKTLMQKSMNENPVTAAEDSSPAPCTKPARTVSDECQRIAKEIGPIRSDKELYALVAPQMRKEPQEVFYVVSCDVHGNLVGFTEVARGQVSRVAVDVEDVLGAVLAIKPRPTAYAICHNHPSSKPRPSDADKSLTEAIRRAGAVAMPNTVFLDHLVIAGGNSREYFSFTEGKVKRA